MATNGGERLHTRVLAVDARNIGKATASPPIADDILDDLEISLDPKSQDATNIQLAADQLRNSDVPVAFPTETVYGLGADATRSSAVRGIYKAKQRPSDNPLIVHFASLEQLRRLLSTSAHSKLIMNGSISGKSAYGAHHDPIPAIYRPLISKFWPGPLTIILPNPPNSPLAPEVTAGLDTFGARMPRHLLALALIKLADRPIAAPSANASTKPSPTAAEHVLHDLSGRIETIIDGGLCDVGVESTVVDGLSQPPLVLRPGGISLEQLRACPGWENTRIGYKDAAQVESQPKAPGMKYRHYSPRATVVLYEAGSRPPIVTDALRFLGPGSKIGIVTTRTWKVDVSTPMNPISRVQRPPTNGSHTSEASQRGFAAMLATLHDAPDPEANLSSHSVERQGKTFDIIEIALGSDTADIARGVFSALRKLDRENVDVILVEGIDEHDGDTAAAVMNRLRKAAEAHVVGGQNEEVA